MTKLSGWLCQLVSSSFCLVYSLRQILTMKLTSFSKADLQVKIAEEQSRNDGIRGIVVSMDNGDGVFHF